MKVKVTVEAGGVVVAEAEREMAEPIGQPTAMTLALAVDGKPALSTYLTRFKEGMRVEAKAFKSGRTLHHFIPE